MRRWREQSLIRYSTPTLKCLLLSAGTLGLSALVKVAEFIVNTFRSVFGISGQADYSMYMYVAIAVACVAVAFAVLERAIRSDERQIRYMIIRRLCKYKYGNPLQLRDGELEPKVQVEKQGYGFRARIACPSADFDKVASLESVISDCLTGKFDGFAVIAKEEDVASRYVDYFIEDEANNVEKQSVYESLEDMKR